MGRNLISSGFFDFLSKCCCSSKRSQNEKTNENLTMETKITDETGAVGTTTIECINDTRFSSIRNARQLKDQTGKIIDLI